MRFEEVSSQPYFRHDAAMDGNRDVRKALLQILALATSEQDPQIEVPGRRGYHPASPGDCLKSSNTPLERFACLELK